MITNQFSGGVMSITYTKKWGRRGKKMVMRCVCGWKIDKIDV